MTKPRLRIYVAGLPSALPDCHRGVDAAAVGLPRSEARRPRARRQKTLAASAPKLNRSLPLKEESLVARTLRVLPWVSGRSMPSGRSSNRQ